MNVLSIDTCLDACSAAVVAGETVRAARSEPMVRGHQERLGALVAEVMAEAGLAFEALDRIAVTTGPGSFTGLRVGLAFAKGLALALDRPCVAVTTLEAMAEGRGDGRVAVCIDARRGQVYLQLFEAGRAVSEPEALAPDVAAAKLAGLWPRGAVGVIGSGAPLIVGGSPDVEIALDAAPDPVAIARLAARATPPFAPARPLYLRAPDARPSFP